MLLCKMKNEFSSSWLSDSANFLVTPLQNLVTVVLANDQILKPKYIGNKKFPLITNMKCDLFLEDKNQNCTGTFRFKWRC